MGLQWDVVTLVLLWRMLAVLVNLLALRKAFRCN